MNQDLENRRVKIDRNDKICSETAMNAIQDQVNQSFADLFHRVQRAYEQFEQLKKV